MIIERRSSSAKSFVFTCFFSFCVCLFAVAAAADTECLVDETLEKSAEHVVPFGSRTGTLSGPFSPTNLLLATGNHVDAIVIGNKSYGGGGGRVRSGLVLGIDEFFNRIVVWHGAAIDRLELYTNTGRFTQGGRKSGRKSELIDIRLLDFSLYHGGSERRVNGFVAKYLKPYYQSHEINESTAIIGYFPPNTTFSIEERDEIKALSSIRTSYLQQRSRSSKLSIAAELEKIIKIGVEAETKTETKSSREVFNQLEEILARSIKTSINFGDKHGLLFTQVKVMCNPSEGGYLLPIGVPYLVPASDEELKKLAGRWSFVQGGVIEFVSGLSSENLFGVSRLQ